MSTLRDLLGVNIHASYTGTRYTQGTAIQDALTELGIERVRDFYVPNRQDQWARLAALDADVLLGLGYDWEGTADAAITAAISDVPNLIMFGGLNEPDQHYPSGAWTHGNTHQQQIKATLKRTPGLEHTPVVSSEPAFPQSGHNFGDPMICASDIGGLHAYPDGAWPTDAWLQSMLAYGPDVIGAGPLRITETGYHNATAGSPPQTPVTETQGRQRTIALIFQCLTAGVPLDLYELFDQGTNGTQEQSWGLYHADGSPKPVAGAISRWMAWCGDDTEPDIDASFALTVTDPAGVARSLQRYRALDNGSHALLIWNDSEVAASRTVTLNMSDNQNHWTVRRYHLNTSEDLQQKIENTHSMSFSLGNEAVLITIYPPA